MQAMHHDRLFCQGADMTDYDSNVFTDLGFDEFEEKLFGLIRLVEQLKAENLALRAKQATLLEERSELEGKNELARQKVQSILSRLKEMEAEA